MAKKNQADDQPSLLPVQSEHAWWMDWCRRLAGEHWIDRIAEESFKRGLSPKAAANIMRAS